MRLLSALLALGIAGCSVAPVTPPSSPAVLQPVGDAAEQARLAAEKAESDRAERDSKLASSVEVIGRQNAAAPESPQKPVIAAEADLMQRTLAVSPTPEDRAAAAEREALMLAGRLEEARAKYNEASSAAEKLNRQIAAANAARESAEAALTKAISEADRRLAEQQAQHQLDMAALEAKWQKRLDDAHNQVMRDQVKWLNWAAAGCEALAVGSLVVAALLGGVMAMRAAAPWAIGLGVLGLLAFGLAQLVGQWWFMWACAAVIAGALGWAAAWAIRHYRQGNLKAEVDARAAKVKTVLGDVVGGVEAVRSELKKTGSITKTKLDELLREWVTEQDGTAAEVDAIRREKGLL